MFTFGDHGPDPTTGVTPSPAERLRQVVEEAELADQVGLDVVGVGEHHRADFLISAPEVVLAAIAARTERVRLTSAVTVLGSDDPVRVFQRSLPHAQVLRSIELLGTEVAPVVRREVAARTPGPAA